MMVKKNVLGKKLEVCSLEPLTGYFRDGSCTHCETDSGQHTLCAEMTDEFLQFSKTHLSQNSNMELQTPTDTISIGISSRWTQSVTELKPGTAHTESTNTVQG